jgi:hypothetical protein
MLTENEENRLTAAETLSELDGVIARFPPGELDKPIYSRLATHQLGPPTLMDFYYTLKAVYVGRGVVERELYEDLGSRVKQTSKGDQPSNFIAVLRYLFN